VEALLALPRDRAQEVDDEQGALGKSLALLTVAERELGIEGLTAPNIAEVLARKFKWKVTRQAISQALDRSGKMVDSHSNGGAARTYMIMEAGSQYLATPVADRQVPASGSGAARRGRKAKGEQSTSARASKTSASSGSDEKKPTSARRSTNKSGPKDAIESLVEAGYFATPRLLGDIRDELRDRRGLVFKSTDLSPAMTRLLREGRLERRRNADSQYEYFKA
jgi:hypothetical protein